MSTVRNLLKEKLSKRKAATAEREIPTKAEPRAKKVRIEETLEESTLIDVEMEKFEQEIQKIDKTQKESPKKNKNEQELIDYAQELKEFDQKEQQRELEATISGLKSKRMSISSKHQRKQPKWSNSDESE